MKWATEMLRSNACSAGNKSPIEKIVHEPKDNYMLKLYFFVSESEIHVLFNEVQPEVFKDCDFYPVEL